MDWLWLAYGDVNAVIPNIAWGISQWVYCLVSSFLFRISCSISGQINVFSCSPELMYSIIPLSNRSEIEIILWEK